MLIISLLYNSISRFFFRLYHYILIPMRYHIEIKGLENLDRHKTDPDGGFLFLSSHPSHLDASLLGLALIKGGKKVTIWTIEYVFKNPYARLVARNFETTKLLKVPNASGNRSPKNKLKIRKLIRRTVVGLQKGENILFFPGGAQKHGAKEEISGKSAVERILRQYPSVNIVLVRIIGLWGSRFSKAVSRSERSVIKGSRWLVFLWNIIKMSLLNLIFFIPKRKVLIEFSPAPSDFPRKGDRQEINRYIENFYNKGFGPEGEPLQQVPIYFWKEKYIPAEYHIKSYDYDRSKIPEEIVNDIIRTIAQKSGKQVVDIRPQMLLDRDIGLDSLEIADLLTELEGRYKMPKYAPKNISTVEHLAALVAGVPVKSNPVKGKFSVIHQSPPCITKTYQICASFLIALLSFFHLHK